MTGQQGENRWDGWAVAGFALTFLSGVLGLVVSTIAVRRTSAKTLRGHGLAAAGIILAILRLILTVVIAWAVWRGYVRFGYAPVAPQVGGLLY